MNDVFKKLNTINVNDKTEKKNGLTYLSWAWAWGKFKEIYPEATYIIKKNENGQPYIYDENLGYMVFTEVTVGELKHEMWLPVMDSTNKAMKAQPYIYKVKEYNYGKFTGNYIDKTVESATMFDINKTIMRCLTKNLAMFGLGLYIYAGEDLPEEEKEEIKHISDVALTTLKELIKTIPETVDKRAFYDSILEIYRITDLKELTSKQYGEILLEIKKLKGE